MKTGAEIESSAFNQVLDTHFQAEESAERRHEEILERAKKLMERGQSCYPWSHTHVQEAITQAGEVDALMLAVTLGTAIVDADLKNECSNEFALRTVRDIIVNYWRGVAVYMAENDGLK